MLDKVLSRNLKRALILCLGAIVICLFFNRQIAIGILVGYITICIYSLLLNYSVTNMLNMEHFNKASYTLGEIVRVIFIALPLVFAVLYSSVLNIFGVVFGELSLKIMLYLFEGKKEREEKNDDSNSN